MLNPLKVFFENKIVNRILDVSLTILLCFILYVVYHNNTKTPEALKDYKDGIQNHLVWNISGQCYFVRPNDNITVYLVKVSDCDRK